MDRPAYRLILVFRPFGTTIDWARPQLTLGDGLSGTHGKQVTLDVPPSHAVADAKTPSERFGAASTALS